MKNRPAILIAAAALAVLAGCSDLPSASQRPEADAAFDSGVIIGSGHAETAGAPGASTASDSTSTTERGGHGFGSGN